MARRRKTFDVDAFRIKVNSMLAGSVGPESKFRRQGMMVCIETVLHETGNYKGFGYLETHEVPDGELPGIIRADTELREDGPNKETEYPDHTRVQYYG